MFPSFFCAPPFVLGFLLCPLFLLLLYPLPLLFILFCNLIVPSPYFFGWGGGILMFPFFGFGVFWCSPNVVFSFSVVPLLLFLDFLLCPSFCFGIFCCAPPSVLGFTVVLLLLFWDFLFFLCPSFCFGVFCWTPLLFWGFLLCPSFCFGVFCWTQCCEAICVILLPMHIIYGDQCLQYQTWQVIWSLYLS